MSDQPTETSSQILVVGELRQARLVFAAVPNGGTRNIIEAQRLKQAGVSSGVSDLLIFSPPPKCPTAHGTVLEMKRELSRRNDVSEKQDAWMDGVEAIGWIAIVGYGAMDALSKLVALGYPVTAPDVLTVSADEILTGTMRREPPIRIKHRAPSRKLS